jgi:hypothetical protein
MEFFKFNILTTVTIMIIVFWDLTLYSLVHKYLLGVQSAG